MKSNERVASAERDQHRTVFTEILERFVAAAPGARAAVLVDEEGETVDYASAVSPFNARVAAAHFRLIVGEVHGARLAPLDSSLQLIVRCGARTFLARSLHDGYALVVLLVRRAFFLSPRAWAIAERDLSREAGWPTPRRTDPFWIPTEVESSKRKRPIRVRPSPELPWQQVDVLGALVGLRHERGFRCRLESGAEVTLVREAGGSWYVDEPIDGAWAPTTSQIHIK